MVYKIFPTVFLVALALVSSKFTPNDAQLVKKTYSAAKVITSPKTTEELVYDNLNSNNYTLPNLESFTEALRGFYLLKEKGLITKDVLTLIDFSLSSNEKRLWVIDLNTNTVLFHSLVAHGRNTGEEFATSFSNSPESYKSSLGFYSTAEVYNGKHGKSLKLDGLERGINSNARERAVVIHGADYVSNSFIQNNRRLGRSLGCPAIPLELTDQIIETIKDKSCLFVYFPSNTYKVASKYLM
ncbi:murein L,D-transpeptidase catalytic domain family protein [Flavobacterium muglaense]|uniref:Murein L,D-transpeptidase catalytic domain family protein n=1 Tax=Flavobacterium muglaense TaxID=2764716 RepID=A0A923N1P5_9FLAO|nr:murein L,D-transpeptidase catalytic domain family protein [Flavobacterium muglaense]MBC5838899.1 murein L,D-transpeptidase catalytic domain family protein [Flavobacterium muglaense]MBC5845402.1 murein L,D-transpeptidase catalytic domain family protein [Flavobacterium muglaense]